MLPLRKLVAAFTSTMALTLALTRDCPAQADADVQILTARVERFFGNLASPIVLPANAFSDLLQEGPLSGKTEQLNGFVEEYGKLQGRYGKFLQARLVNVKRLDSDLVLLTYLYKCEQFPVVWRFAYYRPPLNGVEPPSWRVVRLSFDTELERLWELPDSSL